MGETSEQIAQHLDHTRRTLNANFQELEAKVKAATDWQHYYRQHPLACLGVAFGGAALIATGLGYASARRSEAQWSESLPPAEPRAPHEARLVLDEIKAALIAAAADRVREFVAELVPATRPHLRRRASEDDRAPM